MFVPDLEGRTISTSTRTAAFAVAALLVGLTAVAVAWRAVRIAPIATLVPISVTVWSCAEALTAILLFGRYYVSGATGLAVFGAAYEFAALLAVPYLVTLSDARPHVWLWAARHVVFAALVVVGSYVGPPLRRARSAPPREVGASLSFVAAATLVGAVATSLVVWLSREAAPIVDARTTTLFRFGFAPLVTCVEGCACAFVLFRSRNAASLFLWLALATFSGALEGFIGMFTERTDSLAWYLAYVESSLAACFVLAMLMVEIGSMYVRLSELATRDALTGLHNRRGLDEYLVWAFDYATRRELGLALMVIDIDHFKAYNDRYGHAHGDVALRRVAAILRKSAVRRYDLCARYGGEEFVVALFNVGAHQAAAVAERLQQRVEAARIPHAAVPSGHLSVSIGVGQVSDATHASIDELFAAADDALYRAKAAGRDRYMLATIE
jgi:diguanylate cyclase (GGDEF)-like protein